LQELIQKTCVSKKFSKKRLFFIKKNLKAVNFFDMSSYIKLVF